MKSRRNIKIKESEKLVVDSLIAIKKDPDLRTYSDWSALSKLHKQLSKELKEHFYKKKEKPDHPEGDEPKEDKTKPKFTDDELFERAMKKSPSLRTADELALINLYLK